MITSCASPIASNPDGMDSSVTCTPARDSDLR